jgi:hypothetical protein
MIIEANCTTGEIVEREMNAEELAQSAKDQQAEAARQAADLQKASHKAALLEKLGITESEAALLLS